MGTRVVALLRCGSCRFAVLYFLPAYAAMTRDGLSGWAWVLAAAVYWWLLSLGTELTNRLGDRTEDEVNRPERTALCHVVGFATLAWVAVLAWIAVFVGDILWVAVVPSLGLAVLLFCAGFFGIAYTYGPRLKRSRYLSLAVLTFPFCGTFLVGWALGGPEASTDRTHDLLSSVLPFCVFLGLTIGSLAGIKDVTDIEGDARVGYESAWVRLVRSNPAGVVGALLAIPSVVLLVAVAAGLLPPSMAWLVLAFPCSWFVAMIGKGAVTPQAAGAARELAYTYWLAFLSAALLVYAPSRDLAVAVVVGVAYWFVTSRWLHWSTGLSLQKTRVLAATASDMVSKRNRR